MDLQRRKKNPTFSDLSEMPDEAKLPPIDRSDFVPVTAVQQNWMRDGIVILEKLIPDELIDHYCKVREKLQKPGGWRSPVPYMHYPQIKDISLYEPLSDALRLLIGTPMGLHLNLTGWISTERAWHQDDYLNPSHVMAHYLAVWIALDDIHPDSGPFEYVPGSHRWPLLRREKLMPYLEDGAFMTPDWPTRAEEVVTPACVAEIQQRGAKVQQFVGRKGDVLIWHGRLLHQGSKPKVPGMKRKALISHYSAITHRPDMPSAKFYENREFPSSGFFFPIPLPLDPSEQV